MKAASVDVTPETRKLCERLLRGVVDNVPNASGALLASADGHPVAFYLTDHEPGSTAAIAASSLGLGQRLVELVGNRDLDEIVVRSADGYVVIYSLGSLGAITVLTRPSVNLAMLHLRARDLRRELTDALKGAAG